MDALRSALFSLIFYPASGIFALGGVLALPFGHKRVQQVAYGWSAFHRACARFILRIDIAMEGALSQGQVIYALKHESFFEAIELPRLLVASPIPFAKAELLRIPIWGRAASNYGMIPVERDQGAAGLRIMAKEARRMKATGRSFAIFPEGTRVPSGCEPALRAGFAGIYKLLNLPVVPVAVNSGHLYQGSPKRRGTITYRFGEIIPAGLERDEVERRVHAAINALNPPAQAE
ncbi:1-acyl-sn-glycerol-3-phosphate acyltransferase [Croceicoccus sp. F390]|uniref:1-acyl-sn-glycerol-3-phosphate acyltransferase n=1 Tax=Croceicoccus esteveae TaxID=3075597 RepID=A0ABU2ZHQ8_9SPHN|nr:1-acyl-sn-glycerol-3-phosphate acyltransferase [Croceicoccus sp. F390]MDT0576143.1 1-acyl-sn-glycerol-3-phosphate acyltransferase [Croceicoccus sp. F390]